MNTMIWRNAGLIEGRLSNLNYDNGRKALVPKAKIHAALGCSPDEADAIALTCGYAGDLVEMERPGGARNGNGGAWVSRAAKW